MIRRISKHGADALFWGCAAGSTVFVFIGLNGSDDIQNSYLFAAVICAAVAALVYVGEPNTEL